MAARITILKFSIGFLFTISSLSAALAKPSIRKVQEVNFAEMSLKGTIRNPEGAFLVQKRGVKFLPLYDVKKDLDGKIRESSLYLR